MLDNGLTFQQHCANLGIEPHEFNGPFLMGECIDCGLRANQHRLSQPKASESEMKKEPEPIMEKVTPALPVVTPATCGVDRQPLFRVAAIMNGVDPLTTTWSPLDTAVRAYNMIAGATSLEVKVFMKVCDEEVDLFEICRKFIPWKHKGATDGQ